MGVITLSTRGTKGSITGAPGCPSMLVGRYFRQTGSINSLLIGHRKFSTLPNSKSNPNNLITFKHDKLALSLNFLE